MKKIIFCDLDDTLLQPKTKEVLDEDVQSIRNWISKGYYFVLATARHHSFLNGITNKLSDIDFDCIGWNGAEIYINHKTVKSYPFSNHDFLEIYENMPQYKEYAKITNIDNEYIFGSVHSYTANMFENDHIPIVNQDIDHYILCEYPPIIHINYVFPNTKIHDQFYIDYDNNQHINKELYNCKITSQLSYDITHFHASKEKGIQEYLKLIDLSFDEVAVIGDSLNDIGMFEFVEKSFCMLHGHPQAKEKAFHLVNKVSDVIRYLEEGV